ncbi:hypothetical protein OH76DRAFT_151603 [Lentinus brumalis]|uniref:Uncharacterized protein n=1 Tax=Lentinus brumalis TaxID=2498619 RepID=A0A371CNY6_9APHY|nr:hypothetical protein OH76DRAFT_151603 [Polyporus brumalis]
MAPFSHVYHASRRRVLTAHPPIYGHSRSHHPFTSISIRSRILSPGIVGYTHPSTRRSNPLRFPHHHHDDRIHQFFSHPTNDIHTHTHTLLAFLYIAFASAFPSSHNHELSFAVYTAA